MSRESPAHFSLHRRRTLGLLAVAASAVIGGCAAKPKPPPPLPAPRPPPAPPPPPPTTLSAVLNAGASVNPDVRGRPSPVTVRVYTLKRRAVFDSADFFALYEKDRETLGGDLVDKEEFQMMPGTTRQIDKVLAADIGFVAVFAAFRDIERALWRSVMVIIPRQANRLQIRLEHSNIMIERKN